jgi:hypothetical protein
MFPTGSDASGWSWSAIEQRSDTEQVRSGYMQARGNTEEMTPDTGQVHGEHFRCCLDHLRCCLDHLGCWLDHLGCWLDHLGCWLDHFGCWLDHLGCCRSVRERYDCRHRSPGPPRSPESPGTRGPPGDFKAVLRPSRQRREGVGRVRSWWRGRDRGLLGGGRSVG